MPLSADATSTPPTPTSLECKAWLTLAQCTTLPITCLQKVLLAHQGDISASWHALACKLQQTRWQIPSPCYAALKQEITASALARLLKWLQQPKHHIITWSDTRYPHYLRQIAKPPLVLYVCGNANLLNKPQVAIVGSRRANPLALHLTQQLAAGLAKTGIVVTSGLALGVDAAAHSGALQASTESTVAVLGHGLQQVYPRQHQALAQEIVAQGGALLSSYALDTPPRKMHFPQRNRFISGLSLGTLVIAAREHSGSLITAQFALEQNRCLMVVPNSPGNPDTAGSLGLLQQGAIPISCAHEVLAAIPPYSWPEWLSVPTPAACHPKTPACSQVASTHPVIPTGNSAPKDELDVHCKHLLGCLDDGYSSIDSLMQLSRLTATQFHVSLQRLQQAEYIRATPHGMQRIKH